REVELRATPLPDERPAVREFLNAVVVLVGNIDVAAHVHGDARREMELAVPRSLTAPLGKETSGVCELLDPVAVTVRLRYIFGNKHVSVTIHRDPVRVCELSVACAGAAPFRDKRSVIRELLDSGIRQVRDVDVAARVHGDALRYVELPVPCAGAPPFGEEHAAVCELLDAGIVGVSDEDVPARIHGDPAHLVPELPVPAARGAPLRQERPAVVEFLDTVV